MKFMVGIEDLFALAKQGIYGTVEDATTSPTDSLAQFKDHIQRSALSNGGDSPALAGSSVITHRSPSMN